MENSFVLQCKEGPKPHPEGVFSANCVDLVDLGVVKDVRNGQERLLRKLKLLFETEYRDEAGKAGMIGKTFTASLHPKSKLAGFIASWRGRPVVPGETIDLGKMLGASCTLVISHRQSAVSRTYATIDAVSKLTKKVVPSGQYDPAETRRRIAEWKAREAAGSNQGSVVSSQGGATAQPSTARPLNQVAAAFPQQPAQAAAPKSVVPTAAPTATGPDPYTAGLLVEVRAHVTASLPGWRRSLTAPRSTANR